MRRAHVQNTCTNDCNVHVHVCSTWDAYKYCSVRKYCVHVRDSIKARLINNQHNSQHSIESQDAEKSRNYTCNICSCIRWKYKIIRLLSNANDTGMPKATTSERASTSPSRNAIPLIFVLATLISVVRHKITPLWRTKFTTHFRRNALYNGDSVFYAGDSSVTCKELFNLLYWR